jgi:hypothetical protein
MTFSGCNDLEEEVYSTATSKNYEYRSEDILNLIGPVYSNLRNVVHSGWWGMIDMQEVTADCIVQPANASGWYDGGIYQRMHLHTWDSDQRQISIFWNNLYQGVINANRIIDVLNSDKIDLESNEKNALIAEMKAARAFYYWLIMDNFGAIPIVTEPTQEYPEKTPRSEVYQFIVNELQDAIPNLNEERSGEMQGRFNKWVAKTLLANVYLNAEVYTGEAQWNKVIEQCNDVINSGEYALEENYDDVFQKRNLDSPEMILGVKFDETYAGYFNIHLASWHASIKDKYNMQSIPYGAGSFKGVPQFIDTYDPDDKRLHDSWMMGLQFSADGDTLRCSFEKRGQPLRFTNKMKNGLYTAEDAGYRLKKYEPYKGMSGAMTFTFPFFRYAGVKLMKAESLLRTGSAGQAANIVTEVRQRAFNDPVKAQVTGSELQQDSKYDYGYVENFEIVDEGNTEPIEYGRFLDELGWEFVWEFHRRRDLIRFGVYTKKSWLSHQPNGEYRKVFPIPQEAVSANPNIKQNPDYTSQ